MRCAIITVLLIVMGVRLYAQTTPNQPRNKAAVKHFVTAGQLLDARKYDDAVTELTKALTADNNFIEAHIQLADLLRMSNKNKQAIEHYLAAIAINPEFNKGVYFKLGDAEVGNGQYAEAKGHLQKYLTYPGLTDKNSAYAKKLIVDCNFSIQAIKNPVRFNPVNLGQGVNSAEDEYMPVATADESTLIFTRKVANNEDFYQSAKEGKQWQKAMPLSDIINTRYYNEGAQSISQDGRYLFFTGCNRPDGRGRCDIYIAERKGNNWGKPVDLNPPVNTGAWESQPSISADGRTLYFVSNKAGGQGGYDIWKTTLTSNGWSEPENLGPGINTPYDEQSPYIHPDDNTLYFCSNGWPGLGNKDLFVSRLDDQGKWQTPVNLGYPINTSGDENGLTLTARGDYAFFSSNHLKGLGGFDIYTFEMPQPLRPKLVTYVKGVVTDAATRKPLEADVEIIDLQNNRIVYQDYTNVTDGAFLATLVSGKNYGLNISKNGYLFYSENFSLTDVKSLSAFNIAVSLSAIQLGKSVVLRNIFFDSNKFSLRPESKAELQKLIQFMQANPTVKIEVSGHTDNTGKDDLNLHLSQNRAKAVYDYLVAGKINAARLRFKGYGKNKPVADNATEEGKQKNRRTEFTIIAQ